MPILLARQEGAIRAGRRSERSAMRRGSSSSVKISYPRYSRQEVLNRLAAGVIALQQRLPLKRVVLFGSYASGRFTAASDIDVLVVYEGEPRPDAFALIKRTLDLPRI